MDKKQFKECVERLEEVGGTIEKLPAEVRAAAFTMFEPYIRSGLAPHVPVANLANSSSNTNVNPDEGLEIFSLHSHDKAADNVKLIAASFFSEFGSEPVTTEDIKGRAKAVGITIPDRPDVTIKSAVSGGKKLFTSVGRGKFKVTVHGENYLKETYGVKKGTRARMESIE